MSDFTPPNLPEGYFWAIFPNVIGIYKELPDMITLKHKHVAKSQKRTFLNPGVNAIHNVLNNAPITQLYTKVETYIVDHPKVRPHEALLTDRAELVVSQGYSDAHTPLSLPMRLNALVRDFKNEDFKASYRGIWKNGERE